MEKVVEKELLTTGEAAKYLGVGEQTLRVWRRTGRVKIPRVRVGEKLVKYARRDLDAFIEARKEVPS